MQFIYRYVEQNINLPGSQIQNKTKQKKQQQENRGYINRRSANVLDNYAISLFYLFIATFLFEDHLQNRFFYVLAAINRQH